MNITKKELGRYFDHSLLKPFYTHGDIIKGCEYALKSNCTTVCVNPNRVKMAFDILKGSNTEVCSVVGFPLGTHSAMIKAKEAEEAYKNGATELDTVIDLGALRSGRYDVVSEDISSVVKASPAIVKVILETCYLTTDEIALASKICEESGAHYIMTSTGCGSAGAMLEDIAIIKESVSEKVKIKAAGGISTLDDALAFINAGCSRIGVSKTREIMAELDV